MISGDEDDKGGEEDGEGEGEEEDASDSISHTTASFSSMLCGSLTTHSGTSARTYGPSENADEFKELDLPTLPKQLPTCSLAEKLAAIAKEDKEKAERK